MIKQVLYISLIAAISVLSAAELFPQDTGLIKKFNRHSVQTKNNSKEFRIFKDIEHGLAKGNVAEISRFFSGQTYFSLSNGTSGYYSSNQAYYVLEDFFKLYRVTAFKFRVIKTGEKYPYATGIYSYDFRGKRDIARVYVSLKKIGKHWKITQITIN